MTSNRRYSASILVICLVFAAGCMGCATRQQSSLSATRISETENQERVVDSLTTARYRWGKPMRLHSFPKRKGQKPAFPIKDYTNE
jgi:hypothetical protein